MLTKEELEAIRERCKEDRKSVYECAADLREEGNYLAYIEDIEALLAHIEELEKQIIKWVPVSERVPTELKDVLFLVKDSDIHRIGFIQQGRFYSSYDDEAWSTSEVTHWVELPSSPKEEE